MAIILTGAGGLADRSGEDAVRAKGLGLFDLAVAQESELSLGIGQVGVGVLELNENLWSA